MSLKLTDLGECPGAGHVGKPVSVCSNFFEVTAFPANNVFHYDVTIDSTGTPPAVYRKVSL